ncbi:MAG: hypothetical protein OER22_15460 [Gammaproteobacteria bacterium]|nr:hypothetical protein [Gammaproteobacteria bacterium]MDH3374406.1 hypothetical protein [Gammaproteobacteria bacterium]MDH3408123.1 hypothetical protein [Gammaproteobacteria bacterium]MDH3554007.1 hypothetical protein [Gammaproteobacteria bacterium]
MIDEQTSLKELAAIVSETLESAGIIATLSGGAAVSIYSNNKYQSVDLDFVTAALVDELKSALEPLGFVHTGRPRLSVFEHPKTQWYLEFPPAPLGFGGTYVSPSDCAQIDTGIGLLRIITPTHSVMDRLIAAAAWNEPQSLDQALLVTAHCADKIDWKALDEWVVTEGIRNSKQILEYYYNVNRKLPTPQ